MAKSPKPGLLRIYPQVTPSPNDPAGADKFYQAFGVAIVAWGRLEGLFVACLMVIQIANDKRIGGRTNESARKPGRSQNSTGQCLRQRPWLA
jgi:hypothetical protein